MTQPFGMTIGGAVLSRVLCCQGAVLGPAIAWVAAERAKGRRFNGVAGGKERMALAKELRAALALPSLEVARGLVTKLKQKKMLV